MPSVIITSCASQNACALFVLTLWDFAVLQAAGSQTAVWLQLLERCAAEPDCQPKALRTLALAEQKQW
jgi:hypothetical protein